MYVTDEMLKEAEEWNDFKANGLTSLQNDPKKQREFTVIGNLAEIVFSRKYTEAERLCIEDYDADFLLKEKRIDVKVKLGNHSLKPFYEVSIQAYQINCNVDWYAFFHYNRTIKEIIFLGWISKSEFYKKAKLKKKGERYKNNNHVIDNDFYEVKVEELKI